MKFVALFLTFYLLLFASMVKAGEVLLSNIGGGLWQVSANDLDNVHALDLQLNFDSRRIPGLIATVGEGLSGSMSAINDIVPGVIRLGVASTQPLPKSGILLSLQSSAPGAELLVTSFAVKTVDGDGEVVPTTVRQLLPIQNSALTVSAETVTTPGPIQPLMVIPRRGGTSSGGVTVPLTASSPKGERTAAPAHLPSVPKQKETAAAPLSSSLGFPAFSGPDKRFHSQEGIVAAIERLPQPWTIAAIKEIFLSPAIASQVRQVPPVALADGKSRVSLYFPKTLSQKIPTVGVQGCTLGTILDAKEQGWEIELVIRKDIWPAKALLMGEGDLIQFPVVVVPTLKITHPASDNSTIPATDFDGNGSITALDAYLYVGNLLAK